MHGYWKKADEAVVQIRKLNRKLVFSAAVSVMLSACAFAPGMKMTTPATLPVSGHDAQVQQPDLQVPITDITTNLIRGMHESDLKADEDQIRDLIGKAQPYKLGKGDVLQITVWDHPELMAAQGGGQNVSTTRPTDPTQGFVVDNKGNVQVPYGGIVHVEGMRIDEAQRAVEHSFMKVFVKPQVTVRVASYRSQQIYVDGEVHSPGVVPVNDVPLTLNEAISRAGGFSQTADQSRMVVVRNGKSYPINLTQMLDRNLSPSDIVLKDGDLLRVVSREEHGVYVMGEVNKPTSAYPLRSGKLTLSEAISQAGSVNSNSADAAQVFVVRGSSATTPEVFHLDARSPVSMLLANQFELKPRDVVYVDGNGLVRFSRVLNLLLPAINAGLTGAVLSK